MAPDATLDGGFDGDNCHGANKVKRLSAHLANERQGPVRIIAYSDHRSDLPLLAFADAAYVVNPRRAMRKLAEAKGFSVLDWSAAPSRVGTTSRRLMAFAGGHHG